MDESPQHRARRRKEPVMRRILGWRLVLVILGAGAFLGWRYLQQKARANGNEGPRTVKVERGTIVEKAVAIGEIRPRIEYRVKSKVSGIVRRALCDVGDRVTRGQVLFEIEPDPAPSELVEAERQVELAETGLGRAEERLARLSRLAEQGLVAREELDAAREERDRRRIELARARDRLELLRRGRVSGEEQLATVVRAPAAGTLLERMVQPGDTVVPLTSYQAGTDLAVIADMGDLLFRGTVDEIDVGRLAPGMKARLEIGALPKARVTGRVGRIAPRARDRQGARVFDVWIELDPAPGVELRAGYSATAEVVLREKKDVLVLPERVVHFDEETGRAYVRLPAKSPEEQPEQHEIETGLSDGLSVEVVSGLAEGDEVLEPAESGLF